MDLWKLISLLDRRALFFCAARLMSDDWEGALSKQTFDHRPANAESILQQFRDMGADVTTTQADLIATFDFQYRQSLDRVVINCWHHGRVESAAMWDLYCRDSSGVAIRSTIGRLEALPDTVDGLALACAPIRYVDYEAIWVNESNALFPFTFKRESFEHESEVRLMLFNKEKSDGIEVRVDLHALIERIYVAPHAPHWYRSVIESLIKRYGLEVEVKQSALDDPALR
jgi:hypothetical protein